MNLAPRLPLSGGTSVPQLALGTWPMLDDEVEQVALTAFELGYRHLDTAENYRNEVGVGRAVRSSGLPREDVFVTTKFNREWHNDPAAGLSGCLERLGLDYVDLVLIHWPNPDQDRYVECWEGLIGLREQGLARAIGTSNFKPKHLARLIAATGVAPELNQIELNPWLPRTAEQAYHAEHDIVTEAWGPIGRGTDMLSEPVLLNLSDELGRTPAQIALRWAIQQGLVAAPKSANAERLKQNLDLWSFELTEAQMASVTAVSDSAGKTPEDSDTFGH